MAASLAAGCVYFAVVFAAGFLLGVARVLVVAPAVGEVYATLIELPVILAIAWTVCAVAVRRFQVRQIIADRLVMGSAAFALLMVAEQALGTLMGAREPIIERYAHPAQMLGFAGQILFGLMPLARLAIRRSDGTE